MKKIFLSFAIIFAIACPTSQVRASRESKITPEKRMSMEKDGDIALEFSDEDKTKLLDRIESTRTTIDSHTQKNRTRQLAVGATEILDSCVRAYRIVQLTSKDADDIRLANGINMATSVLVALTKLITDHDKFQAIAFSIPNVFDFFRSMNIFRNAELIAKNNKKKKNLQTNKFLLALLGLETAVSLGINRRTNFMGVLKRKDEAIYSLNKIEKDLNTYDAFIGNKNSIESGREFSKKLVDRLSKTFDNEETKEAYIRQMNEEKPDFNIAISEINKTKEKITDEAQVFFSGLTWLIRYIVEGRYVASLKKKK